MVEARPGAEKKIMYIRTQSGAETPIYINFLGAFMMSDKKEERIISKKGKRSEDLHCVKNPFRAATGRKPAAGLPDAPG